ncbi:flagellar hook protein FlgE [Roseospirillum parvum]|uniref:Flagellar hook protein FlgE n=1 Tax=Roseospirillum parvum TaxID=83401 RepID=A0A1G7XVS3_9PROT|nr:flagellar hook-basal body complex protein [Roseospirillum parvum]SDG88163.1 flagellar hook protein FlgE [Roseospirillum parvum]
MTIWGAFANASMGMQAQSHALGQISTNVANMNTTGYKKTETHFQTVLSESTGGGRFDIYSAQTKDYRRVSYQGQILATNSAKDVALNGRGMLVVNDAFDGSGQTYYTRDGAFYEQEIDGDSYLMQGNGLYVMGWSADADGVIDATGNLGAIRTNTFDQLPGQATSNVRLQANIDSGATKAQNFSFGVYDDQGNEQSLTLTWTPTPDVPNEWTLEFSAANGTVSAPTAPSLPVLTFDGNAQLPDTTAPVTVSITWAGGGSSSIAVDLDDMTQYSGKTVIDVIESDGYATGLLRQTRFDNDGVLYGIYSNNQAIPIAQLAAANFTNPDGLEATNGNMFLESEWSGEAELFQPGGTGRLASIEPASLEQSNVDLADEFSRMILTQNAYSSNATVFRTSDEMVQEAAQLKR